MSNTARVRLAAGILLAVVLSCTMLAFLSGCSATGDASNGFEGRWVCSAIDINGEEKSLRADDGESFIYIDINDDGTASIGTGLLTSMFGSGNAGKDLSVYTDASYTWHADGDDFTMESDSGKLNISYDASKGRLVLQDSDSTIYFNKK